MAAVGRSALARERQGAILAVGDTNAAADNLLEGLLARDIAAVRRRRACGAGLRRGWQLVG